MTRYIDQVPPATRLLTPRRSNGARFGILSALISAAPLAACSGEVDGQDPTATQIQGLRMVDGDGNVYNQDVFARQVEVTPSNGTTITPTLDPALCGDEDKMREYLVVSRDAQKRFRVIHQVNPLSTSFSSWKIFDNNEANARKFNSRPACAMLQQATNGNARFLLVGKSDNNRLYASTGNVPPTDLSNAPYFTASLPTVEQNWDDLNTKTYGSGSECPSGCTDPGPGSPAVASQEGLNFTDTPGTTGAIVLTFISGSTVYAHYHAMPYAGNNWQQRVAAPPLPSGATPIGTPAIIYRPNPANHVFHVVVRAQMSNGQHRFYQIAFGRTQTGSSSYGPGFCKEPFCGSSPATTSSAWTQLPITGAIDSDPALEYYAPHGETLYFRRGTNLMQTSTTNYAGLGTLPLLEVHPGNSVNFTGSPAALGGVRQEFGNHLVVSRTTANKLYLEESYYDEVVAP